MIRMCGSDKWLCGICTERSACSTVYDVDDNDIWFGKYGSYHYVCKGMGNSIWSWAIAGAMTGITGGLLTNPRYLPLTTLCFTGVGMIGYLVSDE